MRLLIASGNEGKIGEIKQLLFDAMDDRSKGTTHPKEAVHPKDSGAISQNQTWEILSLSDLEHLWKTETVGGLPPVSGDAAQIQSMIQSRYAELNERMEEKGSTFEENARFKALGAASYTGMLCLADDSGIEVDYLQGAPGVYSARYAGIQGDDQANNALLLHNMRYASEHSRSARFRAVAVLADGEHVLHSTTGVWEGSVGFFPKGDKGFGYDPLFIIAQDGRTSAELSAEEKNAISHRGQAIREMVAWLARTT